LDGPADFDTTPGNFDPLNVQQYLSGTGNGGGILAVGPNVTARSDFRIFNSDQNATVKTMTTQASFQSICFDIFNEMLNTVPSGVVLSNPIGPRTWITRESHLDLLSSGAITYSGNITTHSFSASPPAQATYQYNTVGGGNTGPKFSLPDPCMRTFDSEIEPPLILQQFRSPVLHLELSQTTPLTIL
jgi:hypothetical protein